MKNLVLLLGSILFYAWGEPRFVFCMLFVILIDFISALFIERYRKKNTGYAKAVLIGALVINIGLLGYFKYFSFFIETLQNITKISFPIISITLPIGISFYTFQSISYLVDVYRGDVIVQHNLIDFAAYIAAFPQLIAGPIVRLTNIETSLHSRQICFEHIATGIRRFIIGLSKKVLIADSFGALCDIFINSNDKSVVFYWVYAISFTLQIYYDFS
ncbi:MAG: MBOAT family O-acyltransferase, partial [Lachnospiraceae bacterium]